MNGKHHDQETIISPERRDAGEFMSVEKDELLLIVKIAA
jgi:hypothetical protein